MTFSQWSTDPGSNTFVGPTFIGEGCPAPNVNDGMRQIMADMRNAIDPTLDEALADGTLGEVTGTLASISALGTAADKMLYSTGEKTFAETAISALARTLLADDDDESMRATLGALGISWLSFADPGGVLLTDGTNTFGIMWGTFSAVANGSTSVTYAHAFPTASFPIPSGALVGDDGQTENTAATAAASAAGFTVYSARNETLKTWYLAAGY